MRERLALVALLDRGIVVQWSGGAPPGRPPVHQGRGHAAEGLAGPHARRMYATRSGGRWACAWRSAARRGRRRGSGGAYRRGKRRRGGGRAPVALEDRDVVETVAARGEQQDQGPRSSRPRCTRSGARARGPARDHPGQSRARIVSSTKVSRPGWSARPRPGPLPPCTGAGRGSSCRPSLRRRPLGGVLCRRVRFTAVRSLTMARAPRKVAMSARTWAAPPGGRTASGWSPRGSPGAAGVGCLGPPCAQAQLARPHLRPRS